MLNSNYQTENSNLCKSTIIGMACQDSECLVFIKHEYPCESHLQYCKKIFEQLHSLSNQWNLDLQAMHINFALISKFLKQLTKLYNPV